MRAPDTFVFPEMGRSIGSFNQAAASPIPFRGHYRESDLPLRRADVTKTGILSVENSSEMDLMIDGSALAGSDVRRFGQAEGKNSAFFKANPSGGRIASQDFACRSRPWRSFFSGSCACRGNVGISRTSTHEQAGRLNRKDRTREVNRLQHQTDISAIALEVGGLGRFDST